ncbi:hypothetical protein [Sorangium sp. So ce854]|uniref:hypothetical protein n=1 Tax=Sorangium sp. So ce854 TaxID=3133322 RepID=UPI003F601D58
MSMRTAFKWSLGLSLCLFSTTMMGCYINTNGDCDWDDDDEECFWGEGPGAPDAPHVERPDHEEEEEDDDDGASSGGEGVEGGVSSGGGGSSSENPGACEADCDCPSGSACVEGACRVPCAASCECAEGESCEGGYCQPPPEPVISCEVDCDCPSGSACVEGACT